jgi:hypothetical protein
MAFVCHGFCLDPASRQISIGPCTRPSLRSGCAQLPAIKLLYRDNFLASINFVPRHCSSARQ